MNLISCDNYGIVLDTRKLKFSKDIYLNDYTVDCSKAKWDGNSFVPFVKCSVCGNNIMENSNDN